MTYRFDWWCWAPSGAHPTNPLSARPAGVAGGFAPAGSSRRELPGTAHQFGCWLPVGQARGGSVPAALLGVAEALDENRAENPPAVTSRIEVADAVDAANARSSRPP